MFPFNVVYVNLIYLILNPSQAAVYLLTYIARFNFTGRRLSVSLHNM